MVFDKIILNIDMYIDTLHNLLLTASNGEILINMNNDLYMFSPGIRMPIVSKKGINGRYISRRPYHSFLGSNILEYYLNNYILQLGINNTEEDFYYENSVLKELHLSYKVFEYTDDTLLGLIIDNERMLGKINSEHMRVINNLENNIKMHMDKLTPLVIDKICKISLYREVSTLEILDDIRNYRLRETKNTLEANNKLKDVEEWKIGM